MKPKQRGAYHPNWLLEYDSNWIYKEVLSLIEVKRKLEYTTEDCFLSLQGRQEISANKKSIRFGGIESRTDYSVHFQINRKLFLSGASRYLKGVSIFAKPEEEIIPEFTSLDYSGKRTELQPLQKARKDLTLSGIPSHLVAVGGRK